MSDLTIRPATVADTAQIRRIAEQGWTEAYGDMLSAETIEQAITEWYDDAGTRASIERDDIAYFVAVVDGTVLGYVSGSGDEKLDRGVLGAIYVVPDHWGEGIGTALLERFEQFCAERGYEEIQFRVLTANHVGKSFYRKHGYEPIREEQTELFGETVQETVFRGAIS